MEEDKLPVMVAAPPSVGPQGPPVTVTAAASAGGAPSQWTAPQGGSYFYAVESCQPGQISVLTFIPSAVAVAAGNQVVLSITQSAAGTETDYRVYRGRLGGTNAPSDVRLIARVAKTGTVTTFTDLNQVIPGTSEAFMLTSNPAKRALTWIQMLPLTQYPLAQTDLSIRWAVLLLGALRVPDGRKHGVIKNILPKNALWRPFNV